MHSKLWSTPQSVISTITCWIGLSWSFGLTQSVAPNCLRQLELRRVGIDGDDAPGLGLARALDHREADAAQAEHGHRIARLHLGGVVHRADAGGDAAAEQADLLRAWPRGLILASETSATTVYSLKVEQPM